MNQDVWLASHPYLHPVAALHARVDAAINANPTGTLSVLKWDNYLNDFQGGVPVLHSSVVMLDLKPAERMLEPLLRALTSDLQGKLGERSQALAAEISRDANAPKRVMDWLIGKDGFDTVCPGLLRFLGWSILARQLRPVVDAFRDWRDEERWLRPYCPTCGSLPGMAQLVGTDPGRRRFLVCCCCRTRWWYRRTGCPFCDTTNEQRVSVLAIEGEAGLRIDSCEFCLGYLKTYAGEGAEDVLLADWTSIHLDILATDRGLKRLATSLYEM
jgi:FdhE protein